MRSVTTNEPIPSAFPGQKRGYLAGPAGNTPLLNTICKCCFGKKRKKIKKAKKGLATENQTDERFKCAVMSKHFTSGLKHGKAQFELKLSVLNTNFFIYKKIQTYVYKQSKTKTAPFSFSSQEDKGLKIWVLKFQVLTRGSGCDPGS